MPSSYIKTTSEVSLFSEVLKRVRAEGLLEKKPSFYITRFAIISLVSLLTWGAVTFLHLSHSFWWAAIPLVILLGICAAQFGFIGHETAHRQVFKSNKKNDFYGRIIANLFAGLSYGFWMKKHNQHHVTPNQIEKDPDIHIRVLAFRTEDVMEKKAPEKFLTRHQGKLFPFLLLFTGFDLLLDSFLAVGRKASPQNPVQHRASEFIMMLVRQGVPIIVFLQFGYWQGAVLWVLFMMSFGLFMGGAFAPNHKGMPLIPKDSKVSFFERQVLTSRNVSPSWLKDNLMGGLNYQVEHHLFPSMPRPALKRAREIVQEFCAEKSIPYTEKGLFESYGIVIQYLSKVGLSTNTDPFVCPMVAQLRPRY
jgi:fatty acid desaturase